MMANSVVGIKCLSRFWTFHSRAAIEKRAAAITAERRCQSSKNRQEPSTISTMTTTKDDMREFSREMRSDNHNSQDPLKLFHLFLKGFCPPAIEDRVDLREELSPGVASKEQDIHEKKVGKKKGQQDDAENATSVAASGECSGYGDHSDNLRCPQALFPPKEVFGRGVSEDQDEEQEHFPFELKERPPTDVMGNLKLLKNIWENWCHQSPIQHHSLKGFCSVLTDQYYAIRHDDRVPAGEECSVGSAISMANSTPQSFPRNDNNRENTKGVNEESSRDAEEDEDVPVSELPNHRRGWEMIAGTIFAILITVVLIQNLNTTPHRKINFSFQTKATKVKAPQNGAQPTMMEFTPEIATSDSTVKELRGGSHIRKKRAAFETQLGQAFLKSLHEDGKFSMTL